MAFNYALHILVVELEKLKKDQAMLHEQLSDKWTQREYSRYCNNIPHIEHLHEAIKKLKA